MMKVKIKNLFLFILFTVLSLILHISIVDAEELSKSPYVDPKGFFKIYPPHGWKVQEYPDDPRGKVVFILNDYIDLRILASIKDFSTFEELFEVDKENARNIEKQFGTKITVEKTTFLGMPAVKRTFAVRGIKYLGIDFMVGNVRHDLQYGAPLAEFNKYLPCVMKSMETYEPIPKGMENQIAFKKHQLANRIRLAKLFLDMGNLENAYENVKEGLEIDPQNQELLKLKEEIEKKKLSPGKSKVETHKEKRKGATKRSQL